MTKRRGKIRARSGFTLIEVLVATVLVAIAVTGVLGGIRSIGVSTVRAQTADLLQQLAAQKLNDLKVLPFPESAGESGDFTDRGHPDITWTVDAEASNAASIDQVTVTTKRGAESQSLTTMMYIRPQTGTATQ